MGMNNLIKKVSNLNYKITFNQQKEHISLAEIDHEIKKDIRKLDDIHMLTKKDANELIEKITNKVKTKDLLYFKNEKNIDLLYMAFSAIQYKEIEDKEFIEIVNLLNINKFEEKFHNAVKCKNQQEILNAL